MVAAAALSSRATPSAHVSFGETEVIGIPRHGSSKHFAGRSSHKVAGKPKSDTAWSPKSPRVQYHDLALAIMRAHELQHDIANKLTKMYDLVLWEDNVCSVYRPSLRKRYYLGGLSSPPQQYTGDFAELHHHLGKRVLQVGDPGPEQDGISSPAPDEGQVGAVQSDSCPAVSPSGIAPSGPTTVVSCPSKLITAFTGKPRDARLLLSTEGLGPDVECGDGVSTLGRPATVDLSSEARKQWLLLQSKMDLPTYSSCHPSGRWIRVAHMIFCRAKLPLPTLHRFYTDMALSSSTLLEDPPWDAQCYPW